MNKKTIRDIDVTGKKVLVRADFNVPLEKGTVSDDFRIRATLPTIHYLLEHDATMILCSHLGRPGGDVVEDLRLDPVRDRLAELLDQDVIKIDECVGSKVKSALEDYDTARVFLLENTRFHPEERDNDANFAKQLANGFDLYVNDAFAAAHRAHASTEGVAHHLPAVAGLLMARELEVLSRLLESPAHPFIMIMGGAKISDKIGVIDRFIDRIDKLLVGGGMANTFLRAKGFETGHSLVEEDKLDVAKRILANAGDKLELPLGVVIVKEIDSEAERRVVAVNDIPPEWKIVDIGEQTVDYFKQQMEDAALVVWNGPLGVFETQPFGEGSQAIAVALASLDAETITGGVKRQR